MVRIDSVRAVLLSAPYSDATSFEVQTSLSTGWRTTGLLEIGLEDGTVGLGEAYVAVFAPKVFVEIVALLRPYLIGKDAEAIKTLRQDASRVTGYWSRQGAAQHVLSALEAALVDAVAKRAHMPAYALLGERDVAKRLRLYASGGDSTSPGDMAAEVETVRDLGIDLFKIRARGHQAGKTAWTIEHAARAGIDIAVDMAQNLEEPGQSVDESLVFLDDVRALTARRIAFLEEPLGAGFVSDYPRLRSLTDCPIAGGETVTTAAELIDYADRGWYDIVQPDATVIGGPYHALAVFRDVATELVQPVVHCWGSAVGLATNYHVAFAAGGRLAEWPLPRYALREELLVGPLTVNDGFLVRPEADGLGVRLDSDIENRYPFREDAVYKCLTSFSGSAEEVWT